MLKIFRNVLPIQGSLERILEEILLFRQSRSLDNKLTWTTLVSIEFSDPRDQIAQTTKQTHTSVFSQDKAFCRDVLNEFANIILYIPNRSSKLMVRKISHLYNI